jgi:regulator of protease activity HflC (stomatin/prohibitin superfamily)
MAEIRRFPVLRHARVNPTSHLLLARRGRVVRSGRGLSLWFRPLTDSIAEIPVDDRDLALMIRGRSADYQDVTVSGVLTYRVHDPELLAKRVDFALDPKTGRYAHEPIERVEAMLAQLAQEEALRYLTHTPVRDALADGIAQLRETIAAGLAASPQLPELGLSVAAVRITAVWPNQDLATAIEAPARERIKQQSDEAAYHRRALAVEKERAIAENELQNRIELARREEQLVEQQGLNAKREAESKAEAARIAAEAEADRVARVGSARQQLETERISAMESAPSRVLAALAAMAFAPFRGRGA